MSRRPISFLTWSRYLIEAFFASVFFLFCRLLPLDMASDMGGWLGRRLGPWHKAHKVARRNLDLIFPELPEADKRRILGDMWDNLGRVVCEYPHLSSAEMGRRLHIVGEENLRAARAQGKTPAFISGHFGNWEMAPLVSNLLKTPLVLAYRPANNPLVDALIHFIRSGQYAQVFAKGSSAARELVRGLKQGKALGFLVDQKLNGGISVPFLSMPAMTSPFVADLALKYPIAVMPSRVVRTKGANFIVHLYPEMVFERTGDWDRDVELGMNRVNELLSQWVREMPSQWFLVHKRWDNSYYLQS